MGKSLRQLEEDPEESSYSEEEEDDDSDAENRQFDMEDDDGFDDDQDEQKGHVREDEMEELEKEYMEIRHKEQDLLSNLKRHKDDDLLKGQAVKNQKALWDKTLELRFLLQKAFTNSNRLPQEPVRLSFYETDKEVSEAYSNLITSSEYTIDSILELQEALLEKNPSIAQSGDGNSRKSTKNLELKNIVAQHDEKWLSISQMHSRIAPFRDRSIDKWQRKTQVTTGAAVIKGKYQAFNQNISDQVAAYMRDPSRMIKQMQLKSSTVGVFGTVPEEAASIKEEGDQADGAPEFLDDTEFYQQLLKEFFETFDPTSSEAALYSLKRAQTKKRKIVDRRASKSRKIRYNVHEKIVNFMAPQPMDPPSMAPKLFENLFGLKNQNRALV